VVVGPPLIRTPGYLSQHSVLACTAGAGTSRHSPCLCTRAMSWADGHSLTAPGTPAAGLVPAWEMAKPRSLARTRVVRLLSSYQNYLTPIAARMEIY